MSRSRGLLLAPRDLGADTFGGGAINPAAWAKTDTETKLSVSGGVLSCAGGMATPAWDDPRLTSIQPILAGGGRTLEFELNISNLQSFAKEFGFHTVSPLAADIFPCFLVSSAGVVSAGIGSGGANQIITPITLSLSTSYRFRIVLKNPGALFYYSTNNGVNWQLLWERSTGFTGNHYYGFTIKDGIFTSDYFRLSQGQAKPAIISTTVAITPALGAELASGTLTVGAWYEITATEVDHFYAGSAIGDTFRATATTALDANNKVKRITLASAIGLAGNAHSKNGVRDCAVTVAATRQAGIITCLDSETTPLYYLHAYVDRITGNAYLLKVENGTTTQLIGAAVTYSAAAALRIVSVGTKHGLYYANAIVGTIQTVDTSSNYGSKVAGFITNSADGVGTVVAHV